MSVLVVLYRQWKNKIETDFVEQISKKATVFTTESFASALQAAAESKSRLIAILTAEDSFPSSWPVHQFPTHYPTMIFTGLNRLHLHLLNMLINSVGTYPEPEMDNSMFQQSLAYLDENMFESDLSLEKVASHIYVSRCHYSRMFHKQVGVGFKEYIMNKRIERAKAHLRQGHPVTEVCYSVGYNDLTHFSRIFKRLVGVNPSVYRQSEVQQSISV
ncbi:helix-turn-helix transcriptional regulator [Paenibacillus chitinolyticus]